MKTNIIDRLISPLAYGAMLFTFAFFVSTAQATQKDATTTVACTCPKGCASTGTYVSTACVPSTCESGETSCTCKCVKY